MSWDAVQHISRLLWYAECKQLALNKISSFVPLADSEEIRMYHSLYITNLFSFVDLAAEIFGKQLLEAWEVKLEGLGSQSGEHNYLYLRELRNAVVHRGEDITSSVIVINDKICVLSPLKVFDRLKARPPLSPCDALLRNVFAICEATSNPVVAHFADSVLEAADSIDLEEIKLRVLAGVDDAYHMPDWVKKRVHAHIDDVPLERLKGFQSGKLRRLLSASLPQNLQITLEEVVQSFDGQAKL